MSDIVLTVDDGSPADAARFFGAGVHLLELLDDLADTVAIQWSVTELGIGSAVSGLSAIGDERAAGVAAARSAVTGLHVVRDGRHVPPDWSPDAVGHAKDLVRRLENSTRLECEGKVVWLDQRLRDQLEAVTPWVREFYGSIRGELTGVNVTRGNRASIRPQGGGRVVHVGFATALAETMAGGLLQFVEIDGMVRQNEDGRNYYIRADDVHILNEPVPSWRELHGSIPDITDGLTVADYLESIRGED